MSTKIEWTERTIQFSGGCTKVSEGCRNCYAIPFTHRLAHNPKVKTDYSCLVRYSIKGKGNEELEWSGRTRLFPENLDIPLKVKKPTMWFVNSMSDLFHKDVPFEFIERVHRIMNNPHIYQILTKRPDIALKYYSWSMRNVPAHIPPWVIKPKECIWFGVSVEDQKTADERIPALLKIPAAVRFVSIEPMLKSVVFKDEWFSKILCDGCNKEMEYEGQVHEIFYNDNGYHESDPPELCGYGKRYPGIDWMIVGGESGPRARPCKIEWVRNIIRQCQDAGVSTFVKQLHIDGKLIKNINQFPKDLQIRDFPNVNLKKRPSNLGIA